MSAEARAAPLAGSGGPRRGTQSLETGSQMAVAGQEQIHRVSAHSGLPLNPFSGSRGGIKPAVTVCRQLRRGFVLPVLTPIPLLPRGGHLGGCCAWN